MHISRKQWSCMPVPLSLAEPDPSHNDLAPRDYIAIAHAWLALSMGVAMMAKKNIFKLHGVTLVYMWAGRITHIY